MPGGLEIPVLVIVTMPYCTKDKDAMGKYEELIGEHYQEPVDGIFQDATVSILKDIELDTSSDEEYS